MSELIKEGSETALRGVYRSTLEIIAPGVVVGGLKAAKLSTGTMKAHAFGQAFKTTSAATEAVAAANAGKLLSTAAGTAVHTVVQGVSSAAAAVTNFVGSAFGASAVSSAAIASSLLASPLATGMIVTGVAVGAVSLAVGTVKIIAGIGEKIGEVAGNIKAKFQSM